MHTSCTVKYVHLIGLKEGNTTDDGECKPLSKSDYIHLMYTTFAEFPGQPLLLFNLKRYVHHAYVGTIWIIVILLVIGRKKSIALTGLMAAVCYGLLYLCLGKYVRT